MKSKKSVAKKSHKPWLGDLVLTPKPASAWFNDILIACKRLPQCLEGVSFAKFSASRPHQDAAMRHIQQIGEAASRQPTRVRLRHPAVDWSALVRLKKMIGLRGSPTMTPRQIWDFVLEIPKLEKWLRETWTKAEREAAEDASDQRVVERHLVDLRAGRVRMIPHEQVMLDHGMDPFKDRMKRPRPRPVYDFGFWEARRPPGGWRCHALALPGILGIGGTAAGAKDCLFTRLALLEKSTKAPGERVLCRRLLGTWKATAAMRMQDFVFWEEEGIWSAVAPPIQGVYGTGPTVTAAKDDLVEALKTMSEYLEETGEGKKAADCGRLVAAWKTGKTKKT